MGRQLSAPSALARFRPLSFAAGADGVQALVRTMGRDSPLNSAEAAAAEVLASQASPFQLARAMSYDRLRSSMSFARKDKRGSASGQAAKTASATCGAGAAGSDNGAPPDTTEYARRTAGYYRRGKGKAM